MLKIKIIAVGKLTEKAFRTAAELYLTRLAHSASVAEVKPEPIPPSPSDKDIKIALSREAARIVNEIPPRAAVVAMCVEGEQKSSEDFADMLSRFALSGKSEVVFIIGSSYGLDENLKKSADVRLSVSKMTFPHELARVMLLEQIYRANEITSGGKYHK